MYTKILNSIFPILKLRGKKHNWYYKLYVYLETMLAIFLFLWLSLKPFYSVLFSHSYEYKNITVFSNKNFIISKDLTKTMTSVSENFKRHNLKLNDLKAKVYITDTSLQYLISMMPGAQFRYLNSTETAYSFNRAIYIKNTAGNIEKNRKGFIILLTHELVHVWQENYYQSSISLFFKPKWITEGYAVYVSGSNNLNTEKKEFLAWSYKFGVQNIGGGDDYRLWGLMVKHAIEHMHKSVDDLHLGKVEYDEVMDSLLKEYNISKE